MSLGKASATVDGRSQQALKYACSGVAIAPKAILDHGPKAAASAAAWTAKNPATVSCVVVGTAGVALMAAPALGSVPVLSAIGFSASGVKAGTLAATVQGSIGNVKPGLRLPSLRVRVLEVPD